MRQRVNGKSAFEDFLRLTLQAVSGYWQKMLYLTSLRREGKSSEYEHWGLARRYGKQASSDAVKAAHSDVFLGVLRSPLRTLEEDAKQAATPLNVPAADYVEDLWKQRDTLLPDELHGGTQRHFDLVLRTLRALLRSQADEPPPSESPRRPPDR